MDVEQLLKGAAVAVAGGQIDDFKISPAKHADALETSAAALSKILRSCIHHKSLPNSTP
jgi:hypothetical protein